MLEKLSDKRNNAAWDLFYEMYNFTPSIYHRMWPGINEPSPSITISLSENIQNEEPDVDEVHSLFKAAFNRLSKDNRIEYILDWCHQGYVAPRVFEEGFWVYPDGDYHLCFSHDLATGTFGHPWERTICVIGEELVSIVLEMLPSKSLKVIRDNRKTDDPLSDFSKGLSNTISDLWKNE